jgi:ribosomal protein S18 acetylase RimI-like enzyme
MEIKKLHLKDSDTAEQLWELQHAAYRIEASLIGAPQSALPPLRDTVETLRQCRETFYGYLTEDGGIAGAISLEQETPDRYVICRMMVHPERFRQGIASLLMQHVLSVVPPGSVLTVTAEIRNRPAIALYKRYGMTECKSFQPVPGITMIRLALTVN